MNGARQAVSKHKYKYKLCHVFWTVILRGDIHQAEQDGNHVIHSTLYTTSTRERNYCI